jgi:hypothetical protein
MDADPAAARSGSSFGRLIAGRGRATEAARLRGPAGLAADGAGDAPPERSSCGTSYMHTHSESRESKSGHMG